MEFVSLKELNISIIYNKKNSDYPTKSYVVLNGLRTKNKIGGIVLETCLRIYDYYLVFMTYNCPFEEGVTVSLLDKNGRLLAKKDIFGMYSTDDFSDLQLYPPNVVTFDFLYKGLWRIEIFSTAKELTILESFGFLFRKKNKTKVY